MRTLVRVGYDGRIEWFPGGLYTVFCQVDTTFFPFDIQICEIDFENWSFRGKDPFLFFRSRKKKICKRVQKDYL